MTEEKLERIDSFDVTFADSFARRELKVVEQFVHRDGRLAQQGQGERRIYVGSKEEELDDFFQLEKIPTFFTLKEDLEKYYDSACAELENPTYIYGADQTVTQQIFKDYKDRLQKLTSIKVHFHFTKTYDKQRRYYLVLCRGQEETQNYNWIRDICLPRVSRLLFVKMFDKINNKYFIYVKPIIGEKSKSTLTADATASDDTCTNAATEKNKNEFRDPYKQAKYRDEVFAKCHRQCVVTGVTDPNLLIACHIKGYAKSNAPEMFDSDNGLVMTPHIHYLFDNGYLSFNEKGEMILSDFFRNMDRKLLNLNRVVRIPLRKENLPYLKWHNENIFKSINKQVFEIEQ